MLESIIKINQAVNGFIWGVPAMICIIGVGLLLSVRTRFIQVRKFGAALKNTIGKIFDKTQAKDGSMRARSRQSVPRLQARSAPATSQALPARLPSAVLAQFSGCGALLFSACVPNFPRLRSQSISGKRTQMANMLAVQCTILKMVCPKNGIF